MHHPGLRLSFTFILQAAASRAWVRSTASTASALPPRPSCAVYDKSSSKSATQAVSTRKRHQPRRLRMCPAIDVVQSSFQGPPQESFRASVEKKQAELASKPSSPSHAPRRAPVRCTRSVAYFDPEDIQNSDWQPSDPACSYIHPSNPSGQLTSPSERCWYRDDVSIVGIQVGRQLSRTPASPLVPLAKTAPSLYQNLLYLLSYRDPFPTLPALLDYHDLHPGLRSTRSYNLLISLALRNRSYGTVPWLLSSMRAESIPGNVETWKLRIRWLVQSGRWDKAWNEVMSTHPHTNVSGEGEMKGRHQVGSALPLPVWLEFFQAWKRDTGPRRARARRSLSTTVATSQLSERTDLYLTRYHTLMNNPPTIAPHNLAETSPKAVYSVVSIMLNLEQTDAALSLSRAYLTSLPLRISSSCARTCLDIIHLHIAMGSSHRGLRRLYETRRTMVSLLSIHPALRPTSTTLALLLAPLRHAKRGGTIAWNIFRAFRAQWGSRTEDRRVRRRVVTLALKEGRTDIVEIMLRSERMSRWAHATWHLTQRVVGKPTTPRPRRLLRPPARKVFRHNGREERHWRSLIERVSRRNDHTK